tara:strand:+ start:527 stop:655 length:129 start_codon:yes stop_codon:yes gene_type:complete
VRKEKRAEIEKLQKEHQELLDKKRRDYENRVSRFNDKQRNRR